MTNGTKDEDLKNEEYVNGMQKYNKDIHIPMLIESMDTMRDIGEFCHRADISRETFYVWLKKHKEFQIAHKKAHSLAMSRWEELPRTNPNINISYWHTVMRNRFQYYSHLPKSKGKSTKEKLNIYEKAGQKGKITIEQYGKLVASLESEIRIKDAILKDKIDDSQLTPEQLAEETGALVAFFISKGCTPSEAAKMMINFADGRKYLDDRRKQKSE